MHHQYIDAMATKAAADSRINAVWLEGSFGRGTADRYSDLDFHVLLAPHELQEFKATVESWLSAIEPLVLCTLLFDGRLINALTQTGQRVDLVLHDEQTISIDPTRARALIDKNNRLQSVPSRPSAAAPVDTERLEQQTKEFWRCISLLPAVIGRNELITGYMGLTVETQLLTDVLLMGYGVVRDRGVKNLNQFLPEDLRHLIEQALSMQGLSPTNLTNAHLGLVRIMQEHGRRIAEKHAYPYPIMLEAAVLQYVTNELAMLNVNKS